MSKKQSAISALSNAFTQPPVAPGEKPKQKPAEPQRQPSRWKGIDSAFPEPGTCDSMQCKACGAEMNVRRRVFGATGFAEAMGRGGHLHDAFECPNSGTDWHNQVVKIYQEMQGTSSAEVEKLLRKEMKAIIKSKKATKKVSVW